MIFPIKQYLRDFKGCIENVGYRRVMRPFNIANRKLASVINLFFKIDYNSKLNAEFSLILVINVARKENLNRRRF